MMGKFILLLSLACTGLLFWTATFSPENPLMWLASTSTEFMYLRIAMIAVLMSLLATHPPRNIVMRYMIGIFAMSLLGWGMFAVYEYSIKVLDLASIMIFSISTTIIILESHYLRLESTVDQRIIAARKSRQYLKTAAVKIRSS